MFAIARIETRRVQARGFGLQTSNSILYIGHFEQIYYAVSGPITFLLTDDAWKWTLKYGNGSIQRALCRCKTINEQTASKNVQISCQTHHTQHLHQVMPFTKSLNPNKTSLGIVSYSYYIACERTDDSISPNFISPNLYRRDASLYRKQQHFRKDNLFYDFYHTPSIFV